MKLSYITDEATQSFDEAVELAKRWNIDGVELRSVGDEPIDAVPASTPTEWRRRLDGEGLCVPDLASSFFKCREDEYEKETDKLKRLCDAADILGCNYIRGFAFFAPETGPKVTESVADKLAGVAGLLRGREKTLLLEADPSVNTTNHASLARLLEKLPKDVFGAIYDPGNDMYDIFGEVPYPDGFMAVKPYIRHVHIKDAVRDAKKGPYCVKIGTGEVDYPGLLAALKRSGYDGWLSLETHYRVGAEISEELMRRPQGAAFTNGGLAATEESLMALRRLMEDIQ